MVKIPCGRVLGHGESCVDGHLCDACHEIQRLRAIIQDAKDYVDSSNCWRAGPAFFGILMAKLEHVDGFEFQKRKVDGTNVLEFRLDPNCKGVD